MVSASSLSPDQPTSADQALARMVARGDIEQVLFRYCRGVDRADWEMMRTAFHDDAVDDHGSINGSADDLVEWTRKRHAGGVTQSMHAITNISFLTETPSEVRTESYCLVHQTMVRPDKPTVHTSVGCRYLDRFSFKGEWRISRRLVRYDWVQRMAVERDFLPSSPELIMSGRDRADPVYEAIGGTL